jgi:stage III sporulation protein AG
MGDFLKGGGVRRIWDRYKYAALVILAGIALLAWPASGKKTAAGTSAAAPAADGDVALEGTEARMEQILSRIRGAGQLELMLAPETGEERQLAQDTELSYSGATSAPDEYTRRSETVLSSADGGQTPYVTSSRSPTYRGALVVCQGAGNAEVKLAVTEAVAALTGLSSDRITVVPCQ